MFEGIISNSTKTVLALSLRIAKSRNSAMGLQNSGIDNTQLMLLRVIECNLDRTRLVYIEIRMNKAPFA